MMARRRSGRSGCGWRLPSTCSSMRSSHTSTVSVAGGAGAGELLTSNSPASRSRTWPQSCNDTQQPCCRCYLVLCNVFLL